MTVLQVLVLVLNFVLHHNQSQTSMQLLAPGSTNKMLLPESASSPRQQELPVLLGPVSPETGKRATFHFGCCAASQSSQTSVPVQICAVDLEETLPASTAQQHPVHFLGRALTAQTPTQLVRKLFDQTGSQLVISFAMRLLAICHMTCIVREATEDAVLADRCYDGGVTRGGTACPSNTNTCPPLAADLKCMAGGK